VQQQQSNVAMSGIASSDVLRRGKNACGCYSVSILETAEQYNTLWWNAGNTRVFLLKQQKNNKVNK